MQNSSSLRPAKNDLASAARAVERMKLSTDREEFEAEWRDFLNCIEKVWVKTERACQPFRQQFEPWQGQYTRLRRKDMLLRYLKQARDADNHSIQDVMEITPGGIGLRAGASGSVYIRELSIDAKGQIKIDASDDVIVEIINPKVVAVKVLNNGEWYNPPSTHLDNPVSDHHPVTLAELGLKFYEKFIAEAEQRFFKDQL
jgi:hypothetical protein